MVRKLNISQQDVHNCCNKITNRYFSVEKDNIETKHSVPRSYWKFIKKWDEFKASEKVFSVYCLKILSKDLATPYMGELIRVAIGLDGTDEVWILRRSHRRGGIRIYKIWFFPAMFENQIITFILRAVLVVRAWAMRQLYPSLFWYINIWF